MKKIFLLPILSLAAIAQLCSQNVGIDILNPTRGKLEVQGTGIGNTVAIFGGDVAGISVQRGNPSIGFNQYFDGASSRYIGNGYAAVQWLNTADGNMYYTLYVNGFTNNAVGGSTTALTISKNGAVGIGVAPFGIARLTVARGTGVYGTALFRGSQYSSHINYSTAENTYIRGGKPGGIVYLNELNGGETIMGNPIATVPSLVKVGINNFNPAFTLDVVQAGGRGLILVSPTFGYSNWQLRTGPALAPGSYQLLHYGEFTNPIGSWHPQTCFYSALSDERVKTDIRPLPDASPQLSRLQPVQYLVDVPSTDRQEQQAGFIAQEIEQVFPSLVRHDTASLPGAAVPDMHFMNYDGLAVYAIKIIQEQQQRINQLKKRLDALKQQPSKNLLP